jgi:hypothetical protein
MILGVSHIVLGSTDLTRDRKTLESIGWKTMFEQLGIPTHPGKRPFMSTQSTEQGLVFMQPPQGTPVELIHYADELPDRSDSPMQMVLPEPKTHAIYDRLTCQLQFSPTAPTPSLITHFVTDLDAAIHFWQKGLGFEISKQTPPIDGAVHLEFRSPISQWCISLLLMLAKAKVRRPLLDGPGFRVLSMVSTQVEKDCARILEKGGAIASTGMMKLKVDGKDLLLDIIQGSDGVMVEVFQTQKRINV